MSEGEAKDATGLFEQLYSQVSPKLMEEYERLESGESQLVHYTSAENALQILRSCTFWLRNVRCMNDFSEVQHGINLLVKAFGGPDNHRVDKLYCALDQVAPGAAKKAIDTFNAWISKLPDITFIGCLSLADKNETAGRLSMWRAYAGSGSGVALHLDSTPFDANTDALAAYSLPIAYLTDEEFIEGIDRCLVTLEKMVPELDGTAPDKVEHCIFWWLLSMAVGLKHPGFHEEREWRIVYIPEMWKSESMIESVECIRGLPQIVQKIPLEHNPEKGLFGANPASLFQKVLIGPTEFPTVQFVAFSEVLKSMGVENPDERISLSLIPLR